MTKGNLCSRPGEKKGVFSEKKESKGYRNFAGRQNIPQLEKQACPRRVALSEQTALLASGESKDGGIFFQQEKQPSQGRGNLSATADKLSLTESVLASPGRVIGAKKSLLPASRFCSSTLSEQTALLASGSRKTEAYFSSRKNSRVRVVEICLRRQTNYP